MNTTISQTELASDYRYALEVMEESDHLGLDEEHARLLREILQRRIDEACEALSVKPAEPVRLPIEAKLIV
jgi:hypothetical protein